MKDSCRENALMSPERVSTRRRWRGASQMAVMRDDSDTWRLEVGS